MDKVKICAELGINHNGNLELAKQMIDLACACGVDMVKMQVYNTDLLYNNDRNARYYKDSKRAELSYKDFRVLADYSPIEWFATPFDIEAVELLEDIGIKRYKVASRSLTDHKLLEKIAKTGKPLILSTGRHPVEAVKKSIEFFNNDVTILYCVPDYPAKIQDLNFGRMIKLSEMLKLPFGFSDHTQGIWASLEAVRLGATIIEKHFTVSRNLEGCDQPCSLEPLEMKLLVKSIRQFECYQKAQTLE